MLVIRNSVSIYERGASTNAIATLMYLKYIKPLDKGSDLREPNKLLDAQFQT